MKTILYIDTNTGLTWIEVPPCLDPTCGCGSIVGRRGNVKEIM
jgi:hypothetical protein